MACQQMFLRGAAGRLSPEETFLFGFSQGCLGLESGIILKADVEFWRQVAAQRSDAIAGGSPLEERQQ